MRSRFAIVAAVSFALVLGSAQTFPVPSKGHQFASPDGSVLAIIRSTRAPEATSESRVELRSRKGEVLAREGYTSSDGQHGYGVTKGAWTPDSQFFVYSLESSGGHRSWHTPVRFFSRIDRKIISLDDALNDAVSNPEFAVSAPDVVTIELWSSKQSKTVSLAQIRKAILMSPSAISVFTESDERFQHSSRVSDEVVELLLMTRAAKGALEYANRTGHKDVRHLFRGVEVHLGDDLHPDLLVLGIPPMRGADNAWFWLVRSPQEHPELVLFAGGDSLELLSSRTNGYRDIRSRWSSAAGDTRVSIFKFDGKTYKLRTKTWARQPTQAP